MLRSPEAVPPWTPVAALRSLFRDDHVHMALVVDRDRLVTTVERQDLPASSFDRRPARSIGVLAGRTIGPDAPLSEVAVSMRQAAKRRLAVVDDDGALLGLLCLKASGNGFCSDDDVRARRASRGQARRTRLAVA